jgi:hypothetical protein
MSKERFLQEVEAMLYYFNEMPPVDGREAGAVIFLGTLLEKTALPSMIYDYLVWRGLLTPPASR